MRRLIGSMTDTAYTPFQRAAAWALHLFTASGLLWALFALMALRDNDYPALYGWLTVAIFVDAVDGPIARRLEVKKRLPHIDGALLDNIVDYLTWTFVPLVLLAQSPWVAEPAWLWALIAMVASVFAFVHRGAKVVEQGFFRGFPSYWSFTVFYLDCVYRQAGLELAPYVVWMNTILVCGLAWLSVANVHFVYPNRVSQHRWFFIHAGYIWSILMVVLVWQYPNVSPWALWTSLIYPVGYFWLSSRLARALRTAH